MNQLIKLSTATFALALSSLSLAQNSGSGQGQINAVIVRPVTVDATRALDFGSVFAGDNSQVVSATHPTQSALFAVTGQANSSISVSFDNPTVTITKQGAGAGDPATDMTVSSFTAGGDTALSPAGEAIISVGAALSGNESNQEAGIYAGQFIVTVTQGQ